MDIKGNRRKFLKQTVATGAISLSGIARSSGELNDVISSHFSTIGFDPTLATSGFIVLLTDIHMAPSFANLRTVEIDQRIIDEVNGMDPAPELIIVSGDLATSATEYIGKVFGPADEALTRTELELGMAQLARFNSNIPIKIIPGNHDTYAYEVDAVLWNEYTNSPPYFTFDFKGLKFIMLNSAHDGALDSVQQTWFENEVASALAEDELYVVMHHPLGASIGGRGVNEAFKKAFAPYQGDVWNSSGHVHTFRFNGYTIHENANVIQSITVTASPDTWNPDGKSPGYSLICVSDGKVAHHYHRDVKTAVIVGRPNPNRNAAWPDLPVPFEELSFPLLICEEGKYTRADYIHSIVAGDASGTWWSYVGQLELDFDLPSFDGRAHQVVFLGSFRTAYLLFTEISTDGGITWVSTTSSTESGKFIYVDIPAELQSSQTLRLRLRNEAPTRFTFNFFLAGFALIPEIEKITDYDQWRWEAFGTILNQGEAASAKVMTKNGMTNLEKFAFNVPPDSDAIFRVDPLNAGYQGSPKMTKRPDGSHAFHFVRRKPSPLLGVEYNFLESSDLLGWAEVDDTHLTVIDLGNDWELVTRAMNDEESLFFRVELRELSV